MNAKRKLGKADRKLLKKAGMGRQFKEMGALACALEDVKRAPRVPGYAVEPDVLCGVRTRRRVRRLRWGRRVRCARRFCLIGAVYMAALALLLLVVGLGWELLCWLRG